VPSNAGSLEGVGSRSDPAPAVVNGFGCMRGSRLGGENFIYGAESPMAALADET
jgi:hypothetical protein